MILPQTPVSQQIFTFREAFFRLGEGRLLGSILIRRENSFCALYSCDGYIVSVEPTAGTKDLPDLIFDFLAAERLEYLWFPEMTPDKSNCRIHIQEIALRFAASQDVLHSLGRPPLDKQKLIKTKTAKVNLQPQVDSDNKDERAFDSTHEVNIRANDFPAVERSSQSLKVVHPGPSFFLKDLASEDKWFLPEKPILIGRDPACDIFIEDIQVSRNHCQIHSLCNGIFVQDMDSTNGIRINNNPLKFGFLNIGDILQIMDYHLELGKTTVSNLKDRRK